MDFKSKIKEGVSDNAGRMLMFVIGGLFMLLVLTIFTSKANIDDYYLFYRDGALEVWKGTFSPTEKERIIMMPGVPEPKSIKAVYSKEEVFPIICNFYIEKAGALLEVPGKPDFNGIKTYLNRALSYATTDALRQTVYARQNSVKVMAFIYKADIAASRRTTAGFEEALEHLTRASSLDPGETEKSLINQKIQLIQDAVAASKKQ